MIARTITTVVSSSAHEASPHGASHIAAIVAQPLKAIAIGPARAHRTTSTSVNRRKCDAIARNVNTQRAAADPSRLKPNPRWEYSREEMRLPLSKSTVAAVLTVALMVLCLGDLAAAVAPHDDDGGCATRLCEQAGCSNVPTKAVALPIVDVATPIVLAPPASTISLASSTEPSVPPDRQIRPLSSRSPPLV